MALSRIIKYEGDDSSFVWKYPHEDFNSMTELIVNESQEVIFIANGQAADTFGPGRYKLDADNIPILTKMANLVTGVSTFHCQVYFINKAVNMAIKWGTDSKVRFVEPTHGVPVELGASGELNMAVSNGRKLLLKLVGTMRGITWDDEPKRFVQSIQASFRPLISTAVKSSLSGAIKKKNIDIVEIDEHLTDLSETLRDEISPGFEEYGLTIPQFFVTNVVLPEEDPNFKKLRELHTVSLQKRMATAEAEIRTVQAESKASYMTAEAQAEARIKEAQREAILQEQITETEVAKKEAERTVIHAQAEAQAAQMAGMAEAAVMQAKGYNQKDVIQAEVQKSYAEALGDMGPDSISGNGGSSLAGEILGLGVGMTAIGAMAPKVGEIMKGFNADATVLGAVPQQTRTTETVTCLKCGSLIPAGAKFCPDCGTKIEILQESEMICPRCGKKTPKGKFCIECGQPIKKICSNCGKEVPENGKFCMDCGTKIE